MLVQTLIPQFAIDRLEVLSIAPSETRIVVDTPSGGALQAPVRTDPIAAVVIVALVALGVVGMALYVVQQAIEGKKR